MIQLKQNNAKQRKTTQNNAKQRKTIELQLNYN